MIGLLKGMTQEIQKKSWAPFANKSTEPVCACAAGQQETVRKAKSFCDPDSKLPCITVCAPRPHCECGCEAVRKALVDELARRSIDLTVGNTKAGCDGNCKIGAFIGFPQKGYLYEKVRVEHVPEIVEETIIKGRPMLELLSVSPDRSYRTDLVYDKESGFLAATHDQVCMVEVAKYFLDFEEGLSCGKCVPCRIGMKRIQESIERIVTGKGTSKDLDQIRALCKTMKDTPLCEFAFASSRPVLMALTHFENEFKAHVERQECPARVCKDLVELQRKREIRQRLRSKK